MPEQHEFGELEWPLKRRLGLYLPTLSPMPQPPYALILTVFLAVSAHAGFGLNPDGTLDTAAIRQAYIESDFDNIKALLETRATDKANPLSRDEKVFAYKYLGVLYAAEIAKVRAENYFNRLLELSPQIELLDMYTSPSIQDMFLKVKNDFQARSDYARNYDALGNPISKSKRERSADSGDKKGLRPWVYWTAGAVAVGAGVGTYFLLAGGEEPVNSVRDIDGRL